MAKSMKGLPPKVTVEDLKKMSPRKAQGYKNLPKNLPKNPKKRSRGR